MADPVTYTFYGTTIPVLKKCATGAISILATAKTEIANAPAGKFPSETEILDHQLGTMLPLRMQPILLAKFPLPPLADLKLIGSTPLPEFNPAFTSFDDMIEFFKKVEAVFDAVDAKAFNESAEKSVDVSIGGKMLHMTGLADYFSSFVVPNAFFHLNALYMILREKGFELGKGVYIGCWLSEQQRKDWAPLRG
ncbi:hypothetical protein GQ44DRAFT_709838 [Phaeosphaeriaceae sp. PMI808]|nr:hypothetical protein GQ44DRAFT_709838 [Phaeosphaeriaceae sp. PMI808]